jgi:hypothetical protein
MGTMQQYTVGCTIKMLNLRPKRRWERLSLNSAESFRFWLYSRLVANDVTVVALVVIPSLTPYQNNGLSTTSTFCRRWRYCPAHLSSIHIHPPSPIRFKGKQPDRNVTRLSPDRPTSNSTSFVAC